MANSPVSNGFVARISPLFKAKDGTENPKFTVFYQNRYRILAEISHLFMQQSRF